MSTGSRPDRQPDRPSPTMAADNPASRIQAPPAGLLRRLGALLYDALLLLGLVFFCAFILVAALGDIAPAWLVQWLSLFLIVAYYSYSWLRSGQTLGMKAWRLMLVDEAGQAVNLQQVGIRLLVAPVSLAVLFLGYLWLYIGRGQQTWHDRASRTFVVQLPETK
ncbi:MAG: RDD family protein [Pseudomonadota bacterium]